MKWMITVGAVSMVFMTSVWAHENLTINSLNKPAPVQCQTGSFSPGCD